MAKLNVGLGGRNPNLFCFFAHPKLNPKKIILPLSPSGVKWDYELRHQVIDTYGGQVVQILGVNITNLIINGQFGEEGMWGWEKRKGGPIDLSSRFGQYKWYNNNPNIANGMVQLADWFRNYFMIVSQGIQSKAKAFERFEETAMYFEYPARQWKFYLRPTSFPKMRFSNDEIAPEWQVEAEYVEGFERDRGFLNDVTDLARERLNAMRVGVGFKRNNPFSEFIEGQADADQIEQQITSDFGDKVLNFSEEDIDELIYRGFTYPSRNPEQATIQTETPTSGRERGTTDSQGTAGVSGGGTIRTPTHRRG